MNAKSEVRPMKVVSVAKRWRLDTRLVLSFATLAAVLLLAIFASELAHDPVRQDLRTRLIAPAWVDGGTWVHPLGTDHLGRDVLARIAHGGRVSLTIAALAALIAGAIGTVIGILAGFLGGWTDTISMRLIDVQLAFPMILLVILLIAVVGTSTTTLIVVLGIAGWVDYARLARAEVLRKREEAFVEAAKSLGASAPRLMVRHILPNVIVPLIILATLAVPRIILIESALSWLGLGVPPPTPSWGAMIADASNYLNRAWWLATIPGVAIVAVVLSIGFIGDWLRDILDPHTRNR